MLGRYLRYRASLGEPVRYEELEYLINRTHEVVAAALKQLPLLSEALVGPANRPARGKAPDPGSAGIYEAVFWADVSQEKGQRGLFSRYLERHHSLNDAAKGN